MNEYEKIMTAYDQGYEDGKNSVLRGIRNSLKFMEDLPDYMKTDGLIECLHLVMEINSDGKEKEELTVEETPETASENS